jgi:hypothetical protein
MVIGSYMAGGDNVTATPTDHIYTVAESGGAVQPVIVLFTYDVPGVQVWAFGDSHFQGVGTAVGSSASNGVLGWPTLVDLQNSTIDVLNIGVAGQKTVDSIAVAKRMISATGSPPKYACIKVYSPNDAIPTQAAIDGVWAYVLDFVEFCRVQKVIPVLFTSPPKTDWTTGQNVFNEAQNTRARSLVAAAPWIKLVDIWAAWKDPANQYRLNPAWDYDATHVTLPAHQAAADLAVPVFV